MSSTSPPLRGRATRSSLACLTCRSRHLKCDGKRPCCSRCTELVQPCQYARSRRGGLDRVALEERRKRIAASETSILMSRPNPQSVESWTRQEFAEDFQDSFSLFNGLDMDENLAMISLSPQIHFDDIQNDSLIDAYYKNFHKFHPFLLPQTHFARLSQDPSRRITFEPLVAVMRLVGNIYCAREWSIALKDHVEASFSQTSTDPVMVQCRLLYSIALFWYEHKTDAKSQIHSALRLATELRMFEQDFASKHGAEDCVLQECWRRTWWTLYIVDAYYAGTLGTMNFEAYTIECTVGLPCEEAEYESGNIPEPQSLDDFENREFADDSVFSSFAYLIGAVQCAALAISTVPKTAEKDGSRLVIQAAEATLNGWILLLPKTRKQVMSKTGEIDELMFQAHLLIHVSSIGVNRMFSDLKYSHSEVLSSCARAPPLEAPTPDLVNVHTVRVLRSAEAQIRLLALPAPNFCHSPFTTCMVSEGTLALLSACSFLLRGKDLAIARGQIRMTIGCLKELGEIWPRTTRNVREIQTIANHVLGLNKGDRSSDVDLSSGEGSLWSDVMLEDLMC